MEDEERILMFSATCSTLKKLKATDPLELRTLAIEGRLPLPFCIEVTKHYGGTYTVKEDCADDWIVDRWTGNLLQYDLNGVMLWLSG
jgi:hypothetical protein